MGAWTECPLSAGMQVVVIRDWQASGRRRRRRGGFGSASSMSRTPKASCGCARSLAPPWVPAPVARISHWPLAFFMADAYRRRLDSLR